MLSLFIQLVLHWLIFYDVYNVYLMYSCPFTEHSTNNSFSSTFHMLFVLLLNTLSC